MKLTFSPIIGEASGSVGGATFSRWKGRAYIRTKVTPANPNSAAQQAVRASMAQIVAGWQGLVALRKAAYGLAAAPYSISGYNLFVKLNRAVLQAETSIIGPPKDPKQAAPAIQLPADLAYDSEPGAGQMKVTWTDPGQGVTYFFGSILWDFTTDSLVQDVLEDNPMSSALMVYSGLTIGHDYALAGIVYRDTDDAQAYISTVLHTQLT